MLSKASQKHFKLHLRASNFKIFSGKHVPSRVSAYALWSAFYTLLYCYVLVSTMVDQSIFQMANQISRWLVIMY